MKLSHDEFLRIVDAAEQAGLLKNEMIKKGLKSLYFLPDSEHSRVFLENFQRIITECKLAGVELRKYLPSKQEADGILQIGQVAQTKETYGFNLEEATHFFSCGQSGTGKTSLAYIILLKLIELELPSFVFSFKREFRGIKRLYPDRVDIFRWEEFQWNPLNHPPNISLQRWLTIWADCFCQSLWLLSGSKSFLISQLSKLFELYDIEKENAKCCPTLYDLFDHISSIKIPKISREARFLESIHNRLEGLISGMQSFNISKGLQLNHFIDDNRTLILELDQCSPEHQVYMVTAMMSWVFLYQLGNLNSNQAKKRVSIILDECQRIYDVNSEKRWQDSLPEMSILTEQFRVAGNIFAFTQSRTMVSQAIKQNSMMQVAFRQADGREIEDVARTLRLNKDEAQLLGSLEIGEAIAVKGTYPLPVKIKVAYIGDEIPQDVSDEEVKAYSLEALDNLTLEPRLSLKDALLKKGLISTKPIFNERDEMYIRDVFENTLVLRSQRYQNLKLSPSAGNVIIQRLISNGILKEVPIGLPKGYGKLDDFTSEGLKRFNLSLDSIHGQGTLLHRRLQNAIKIESEKNGCKAKVEYYLNGKKADVGIEKDREIHAVEISITTNPEHEIENIIKDLNAGFQNVYVICRDRKIEEEIKALAKKNLSAEKQKLISYGFIHKYIEGEKSCSSNGKTQEE